MKYRQQTYLLAKNSSATSYVAATFHPTIGQRAHQSFSNAATPVLGMIPPRIRVNYKLPHSQGDTNSKPTQLGFTGFQQTSQASTVQGSTIAYQQQNNFIHCSVMKA